MGCCCAVLEKRVQEKFLDGDVIAKEIYWLKILHIKSKGCFQFGGEGALVLTTDVLWFTLLCCPKRQVEIPLRNIRQIGLKYLERWTLSLEYADADSGIEDEAAFELLHNAEAWARAI